MTSLAVRATSDERLAQVTKIAEDIAGPASRDVDERSRFPIEAFDALRAQGLLSSLVPTRLGGEGASVEHVATSTAILARYCASTAMIHAMHHLEVACLVEHGRSPYFEDFLRDVANRQLLLASATTEVGVGGDIRSSKCAVIEADGRFTLEKLAPVISYGEHADGILVTARRTPDSPANDQVLVLCTRPGLTLEPLNDWNVLGFRGTCSPGFRLRAEGGAERIVPVPFADVAAQTLVPVAHILWSHVWLGIAAEATDRARRYVQAEARKHPETASSAPMRLAELMAMYQRMSALVRGAAKQFDASGRTDGVGSTLSAMVETNSLKVNSSTMVVEIVTSAMNICGIASYRLDTPWSMGRLLRDALGAALMVNNDRILGSSAQLLLVDRSPVL